MNFIFETSDLQYASPATVSRMGMIFLNNEDISINSIVNRWVNRYSEDQKLKFKDWIESYLYPGLELLFQHEDKQIVPTTRVGMVMNILSQLTRLPTTKQ